MKNFKNMSAVIFILALFIFAPRVASASPDYRGGEVIVVLKNNVGQLSAAALDESSSSGYVRGVAGSVGADVRRAYSALSQSSGEIFAHLRSDTKTTDEMIAELKENPDVIAVSPNYIVRALARPNEPDYERLWGMPRIGAETAWGVTTGDLGIYVAVIDSGIQQNHPDLMANADTTYSKNFTTANLWGNRNDFSDEYGHGTHVSGIIGAVGNNGEGVAGVNWRSNIITLKVLGKDGTGDTAWEIEAIDYIIELLDRGVPIRAVNLSLGGVVEVSTPDKYIGAPEWLAFKALDKLNKTVMVVAAGNDSVEVGTQSNITISGSDVSVFGMPFPASLIGMDNMIVVGSVTSDDQASEFSNWSGRYVLLAAPGSDIYSTSLEGKYEEMSGTSMAAPHVAGAVALLASAPGFSGATATELKSHLLRTANGSVNPNRPGGNESLSAYGLVDVGKAVNTPLTTALVTNIDVRCASNNINENFSATLAASVMPETATDKSVSWSSLNPDIATVDSGGRVKGVSAGSANIVATANDGSGVSAVYVINVKKSAPSTGGDTPPAGGGGSGGGGSCGAMYASLALGLAALAMSAKKFFRR